MTLQAIGERVIVEVLDENETTASGLIRSNTQGAKCKGKLVSIGSEAKEKEPKLEEGQTVMYYKQPTFNYAGTTMSEFTYQHLIAIES